MHPSLQSVPPQAPERGSDQVAALPTLRDVWQDLDVAIHTASSVQASNALRIDERVPSAIRQRLAGAVELVRDAGQMLKQWTEVLDARDPVEMARAGRLECLQSLRKAGHFLDLYSPHRSAAGEARRAEAWLAALAACKAGHPHVLRWLFRGGWPRSFDADAPWHLRDMAESWMMEFGAVPQQDFLPSSQYGTHNYKLGHCRHPELACYPPEVELYRSAMRTPSCLDVLLEAGARSAWICRAAVLEGRPDLLVLAVARGCPCDAGCLYYAAREGQVAVLEALLFQGLDVIIETSKRLFSMADEALLGRISAAKLVQQAGAEAATRGQEACLEVLLRWHPDLVCGSSIVACAAARAGNLNCLQSLQRAGLKDWSGTMAAAAGNPDNLPCLRFAFQLEPLTRDGCLNCPAFIEAARAGSSANLLAFYEVGRPWSLWRLGEVLEAIKSGNSDAVKICFEHIDGIMQTEEYEWRWAMEAALKKGRDPAIVQLIYEAGFPPNCMRGWGHPAALAIEAGMLEAAQIAVKYSGVPELLWLDTTHAAKGGEALLRYVHGLGGALFERTAEAAARAGQLGALRYAVESGGPWQQGTLVAAIEGDSLDCLRYAHEGGCPLPTPGASLFFPAARSLPVLRYVCEHMESTWSAGVLRATADSLARSIREAKAGKFLDWQMALYTVKHFVRSAEPGMRWEDLPVQLAEAVLVRRERAAALAGVFFKAGQLGQARAAHLWAPVWRSVADLPRELRQRIAFEAHLVLPAVQPC